MITQKEVAETLNISEAFVSCIRKGEKHISRERAINISKNTGIPVQLFIENTGQSLYSWLVAACSIIKEEQDNKDD